jgi:hypothetical protein
MSDSEKTIGNVMHDAGYVTGFLASCNCNINTQHAEMGWDRHTVFLI